MAFFLALFGLGIALFQTLILSGLYGFNLKPKWIVFVITPVSIFIPAIIDEDFGSVALLIHFVSVFVLGILGLLIKTLQQTPDVKPENNVLKSMDSGTPTSFLFNPLFSIMYQLYIIVVIGLHIFVPSSDSLNSGLLMNEFYDQFYFQIFSIFFLLLISVTYLSSSKIYNAEKEVLFDKISNPKVRPFFSNKWLSLYIVLIGIFLFFNIFNVREILPILLDAFANPSGYTLYISFFCYLLFQIILIIINPKQATFINLKKAKTIFSSAFMGIFMAAALIPVFIILESKLDYFNMSSEIVLFLGFNIIMLSTEIIFYRRRNNTNFIPSKKQS